MINLFNKNKNKILKLNIIFTLTDNSPTSIWGIGKSYTKEIDVYDCMIDQFIREYIIRLDRNIRLYGFNINLSDEENKSIINKSIFNIKNFFTSSLIEFIDLYDILTEPGAYTYKILKEDKIESIEYINEKDLIDAIEKYLNNYFTFK